MNGRTVVRLGRGPYILACHAVASLQLLVIGILWINRRNEGAMFAAIAALCFIALGPPLFYAVTFYATRIDETVGTLNDGYVLCKCHKKRAERDAAYVELMGKMWSPLWAAVLTLCGGSYLYSSFPTLAEPSPVALSSTSVDIRVPPHMSLPIRATKESNGVLTIHIDIAAKNKKSEDNDRPQKNKIQKPTIHNNAKPATIVAKKSLRKISKISFLSPFAAGWHWHVA